MLGTVATEYPRVWRLLRLIRLLQGRRGVSVGELAERLETSERNAYRDLAVLREMGMPVVNDPGKGGHHLEASFFMPPLELTSEEALALIALGERVGETGELPYLEAAGEAIEKLRSALPARVRDELDPLDGTTAVALPPRHDDEATGGVFATLRRALAHRRALACRYESLRRGPDEADGGERFLFYPYRLFFCDRAWYAVGHHGARNEVRKLKLNRFRELTLTELAYEIPRGFSLDGLLGEAWRMIPGETRYEVALDVDPVFANNVGDTRWHRSQRLEQDPDGTLHFYCTVDGLDEIQWWVLARAPHVTVRRPPELAERVRALAEAAARRHGGAGAAESEEGASGTAPRVAEEGESEAWTQTPDADPPTESPEG